MGLNKWNIIIALAALGAGGAVVAGVRHLQEAKAPPPIGHRQYSLGSQDSPGPVVIEAVHPVINKRIMRDPDQPGHVSPPPKVIVRKKPPVVKEQAGSMRFKRLHVPGTLQHPRLAFRLETLPLERADEPIQNDFYPKVFEPAQDDAF